MNTLIDTYIQELDFSEAQDLFINDKNTEFILYDNFYRGFRTKLNKLRLKNGQALYTSVNGMEYNYDVGIEVNKNSKDAFMIKLQVGN